ncbi:hypothetical protein [Amycolatopsis sp. cmx-11-12]|uniref:hypothetical protein n=1 Tax=Amycolatopsis sp. cmx-11-12 TaxID=2785795 RepID=UPI0039184964
MRHYLMVRPSHFDAEYSINPWMDPGKPTDTQLAIAQWEWLRDLHVELGHPRCPRTLTAGRSRVTESHNGG